MSSHNSHNLKQRHETPTFTQKYNFEIINSTSVCQIIKILPLYANVQSCIVLKGWYTQFSKGRGGGMEASDHTNEETTEAGMIFSSSQRCMRFYEENKPSTYKAFPNRKGAKLLNRTDIHSELQATQLVNTVTSICLSPELGLAIFLILPGKKKSILYFIGIWYFQERDILFMAKPPLT